MDSTLSYGLPRVNESGTLLEGIALWGELKPALTADAVKAPPRRLCRWSIARGTLAIRSHVDTSAPGLLALRALLQVREDMRPWLDLPLVSFPPDGVLRLPAPVDRLERAKVVGGDWVAGSS